MRFLSSAVVLLAICGLAAAGHLYHNGNHGAEHHGSSYSVVTKHEQPAIKHEWSHGGGHDGGHEAVHFEHQGAVEFSHDDGGYDGGHEEIHGHEESHDFHAHPKYEYDYAVKDEKTGDDKNHWETRDGDKVKGAYSVKEADGTTRIVEYTADHKNGFNAVVKTVGHAHESYESHGHGHEAGAGHGAVYESHDYGHYSH